MNLDALVIKKLSKIYANGFQALYNIDLKVSEGDFFALLGPNGAGKSTTIGIITSLIKKSRGSVKIFDTDIDKNFTKAKSYVGLVPQEFNFNTFEPVREILINQAGYYGIQKDISKDNAYYLLKKLGLWEKRYQVSRNLSGGMKRRLMIARALIHKPKLLILDEPTAGADIEVRRLMWDYLKEINNNGTTIILTTHYLEEAEKLCKNIAIIDKGKILENKSMKDFLSELRNEEFILYTEGKFKMPLNLNNFNINKIDDNSFSVIIKDGFNINDLLDILTKEDIKIKSMKNKTSRLEELFIRLVKNNDKN
mgnify:CR=1 FL=1